jgi:hypothetical protein
MAQTSRKIRLWIVISVLYLIGEGMVLLDARNEDEPLFWAVGATPLIIGWGIWWILQGKK